MLFSRLMLFFRYTIRILLGCLMLGLSTAQVAYAGGSSDGGGKGIICSEADGTRNVYLADTFPIRDTDLYKNFHADDSAGVVNAMAEIVERLKPEKVYPHPVFKGQKVSLAWMIVFQRGKLDIDDTAGTQPELPDDHIDPSTLPPNCRKVQIAVQDFVTGYIAADISLIHRMTMLDRGLLELHETLLSLRNRPGLDTTPIRQDVQFIFEKLNDPKLAVLKLANKMINPDHETRKNGRSPSGLPTLLNWPRKLTCLAQSGNGPATQLTLELIEGNGRPMPEDPGTLEVKMDSGKKLKSTEASFKVRDDIRANDYSELGMLEFSAEFVDSTGNKAGGLGFWEYRTRTNEFVGRISFRNLTRSLSCFGAIPKFGVDDEAYPRCLGYGHCYKGN